MAYPFIQSRFCPTIRLLMIVGLILLGGAVESVSASSADEASGAAGIPAATVGMGLMLLALGACLLGECVLVILIKLKRLRYLFPIGLVAIVAFASSGREAYRTTAMIVRGPSTPTTSTPTTSATLGGTDDEVIQIAPTILAQGDPGKGETTFIANCAACHQQDGRGKIGLAPSIRNRDFLAIASDTFIYKTIRLGRSGTAMVPRTDLPDEDIADIIAYLRAMPVANPLHMLDRGELSFEGDPTAGSKTYTTFCASCHGPTGEGYVAGGSGPGIGLPGFLAVASNEFIYKTLEYGRVGTAMMPFLGAKGLANLTDQDAFDIISFLRSEEHREQVKAAMADRFDHGPSDPVIGEKLFTMNCASCHQQGGVGHPGLAPSIRNRDFLAIASDSFIRSTIKQGRMGTTMMARADLSDGEIDHIIAYLRALPVANPVNIVVDATKQFSGDVREGGRKFAQYCASCHGPAGEGYLAGGSGPGIGLAGFLNVANDDYIFQTLKQGRVGTAMKPFLGAKGLANLNEQDVSDIIVWLRNK